MIKNYFSILLIVNILFHSYASSAKKSHTETVTTATGVTFVENNGQWPGDILYRTTATSINMYLLKDGVSFTQFINNGGSHGDETVLVWNMKFLNPSSSLQIKGSAGNESVYSYLYGNNPEKWVIHPDEYAQLNYKQLYNNIDLQFYGNGNSIKNDYIVHPGGNISDIKAYYEGIKEISINKKGELEITTPGRKQVQKAPVAWQEIDGIKKTVRVKYIILNDTTFGFKAVKYDMTKDLIIDPLFDMVWSSYTKAVGGSNNINYCFSNATDADGNVYLTGMVDGTYPVTPGAYSGPGTIVPEIFVSKFDKDGTTLLYSTYISGSSSEMGLGIAVDNTGRAYITGYAETNITGSNTYPTTASAYQPAIFTSGGADVVFSVLNTTGTGLDYSTFLGGSNGEEGYDITIDNAGMAYITGFTSSVNFPLKATGISSVGTHDVFVAKFDISQSGANSLVYSTKIGGNGYGGGRGIAVNSAGNAFITGYFQEFGTPSYPVTPGAFNTTYNGGGDNRMAIVTRLSANLPVTIDFASFIGPGTGTEIAVDNLTDEAFITGDTRTFTFPVTANVLQPVHGQDVSGNANGDVFVTKFNATGTGLVYSTFIGGEMEDNGTGITVNTAGEAYVTGTASATFPVSAAAYQPFHAGALDFFVVALNAAGSAYGCGGATFIGGTDQDYGTMMYDYASPKISIRNHGGINDTIIISGTSHSSDFPTTAGSYETAKINGIADQPVFFKLSCQQAGGAVPGIALISSDTSWCDKKAIDFFDQSTNNPTSWEWHFQGAVPDTSTAQNPQGIYYPSYGSFDVSMKACNQFGCDSITYVGFINEFQLPPVPVITYLNDTLFSTPALNYQWFDANGAISGQSNSWFVPIQPGTYFITITDSLGCSVSSNIFILTGIIHQASSDELMLFPNPVSDEVTLSFYLTKPAGTQIIFYDVDGRAVMTVSKDQIRNGANKITLSMLSLKSGIYFCKMKSDKGLLIRKLVKL